MVYVCIAVALMILLLLTPKPMTMLIRAVFEKPFARAPEGFSKMVDQVVAHTGIEYPSGAGDNLIDIYLPKGDGVFPVILWAHGGAYVSGHRHDLRIYATALAAHGYAFVSMDYRRAPEAKYPSPVRQMGEVYQYLSAHAAALQLNMNRFAVAGDSAGAHIAAQFALIQINPNYAAQVGIAPVAPIDGIKAMILCCGPYDMAKIDANKNKIFNVLIRSSAWAYFGARDWRAQFKDIATIGPHVTKDFPPSFITDANAGSFEAQARALVGALEDQGVFVTTHYVPEGQDTIHEYQFLMDTQPAIDCFSALLAFLEMRLG